MGYMVRTDPAQLGPRVTTFRIGVANGDRTVLPPTDTNPPPPPPVTSIDDGELWVQNGPPPATPPPGAEPGDAWIDVASGDVFVLDE